MSVSIISDIHKALKEESILNAVSGWIFTNFHNRDSFTDELLSIPRDIVSTRRWIYIVLTNGTELKIQHAIEPHALDTLPSSAVYSYSSQTGLQTILTEISVKYGNKFAVLSDADISVISTVDGGFISLLEKCGITTTTAAPLVQRCKGLLSQKQIDSQERAETVLYQIVYDTWQMICNRYSTKMSVSEYEVQQFIMSQFEKNNLITDHPPIVAFGPHAGDPHYEPSETESALAREGDVIQLDIWAKEKETDSIYADISWVCFYGKKVPDSIAECWETLTKARDCVCPLIESSGKVTGAYLDENVRKILIDAGYEHGLKHRTGHGIDTECHGSGVNLDSVEFPDRRFLLEGSCFSVEPGLYFNDFGLRTEIDIYIKDGKPVISGRKNITCPLEIPQKNILTIL
ncbi:MAG: aminopeptidase P family protein [Treponema sp.]|nr:aminopeptidase P family protein [Candidatus Treponema caballi]